MQGKKASYKKETYKLTYLFPTLWKTKTILFHLPTTLIR